MAKPGESVTGVFPDDLRGVDADFDDDGLAGSWVVVDGAVFGGDVRLCPVQALLSLAGVPGLAIV